MPNEISSFITILLGLIIAAVIPAVVTVAYRFVSVKIKEIEASMSVDQLAQFRALTGMVTMAANQAGIAGLVKDKGTEKKQWAVDALQAIVDAHGWKIPVEQISAEIEAAVAQGWQTATAPPALPLAPTTPVTQTTTTTTTGGDAATIAAPDAITAKAVDDFLKANSLMLVPRLSPSSGYTPDALRTTPTPNTLDAVPSFADDTSAAKG